MGKVTLSKRTKNCKTANIILSIIHFLCLFGPFLYFIPYGFITGETVEKLGMGITIVISIILAAISLIVDQVHRQSLHKSVMWIMIVGVLIVMNSEVVQQIETFVYIMAGLSILDELLIVPLKTHYKTTYKTNLEIDRRG